MADFGGSGHKRGREPHDDRDRERDRKRSRHDDEREHDREQDRDVRHRDRDRGGRDQEPAYSSAHHQPPDDAPLLPYQQWLQYQHEGIPLNILQRQYEDYKADFNRRHSKAFFNKHKDEAWFKEKYDPATLEVVEDVEKKAAIGFADEFLVAIVNGTLDWPNYDADAPQAAEHPEGQKDAKDREDISIEEAPVGHEHEEDEEEPQVVSANSDAPLPTEVEPKEVAPAAAPSTPSASQPPPRKRALKLRRNAQAAFEPPESPKTVFLPLIPGILSREQLLTHLNRVNSGKVETLIISDANPVKNFARMAWATFSTEEAAKEAINTLQTANVEGVVPDTIVHLMPHSARYEPSRPFITPRVASSPQRIRRDLEQVRKVTRYFDDRRGITRNLLLERVSKKLKATPAEGDETATVQPPKLDEKKVLEMEDRVLSQSSERELLDLFILYLRRVHGHDYYSGKTYFMHSRSVLDRILVLRGTQTRSSKLDGDTWARDVDRRSHELIELLKDGSWPTGSASINRAFDDMVRQYCVKERDDRFRCNVPNCGKVFKADRWVAKHIENKHEDLVQGLKKSVFQDQYWKNYIADPDRLMPSSVYPIQEFSAMTRRIPMADPRGGPPQRTPDWDRRRGGMQNRQSGGYPPPMMGAPMMMGGPMMGPPLGRYPPQQQPYGMPSPGFHQQPPSPSMLHQQGVKPGFVDLDRPSSAPQRSAGFDFDFEKALEAFTSGSS